jgi:N-acetyl sugar amidotransferase
MKSCTNCLLPETHETITFDKKGSCNICTNFKFKNENVNWKKKKRELDQLIKKFKGKYDYDCIIPFSGGKDSTWTLYYLIKEYNLKPLVVRFDHGFFRPNLEENVKKISRNLGVDIITFTPNWKVVQKLMLQSLLEKGDFCWHCHTGIFSYPMHIAVEKKIPLLFWGEPSAEYTAYYSHNENEQVDEKRFNRFVNLGINAEDMYLKLKGEVDIRDLKPYTYPNEINLKNIGCTSVCLGSYIKWDPENQAKIISKKLGWKGDEVENVPSNYNYEKIECYMQGVRDYLKFIKRGYSRPSHLAAIDLRSGRISKQEAILIKKNFEGKRPPSLDLFLDFIGISENEFLDIAISHQVSPNIHDPSKTIKGKKTKDFESWSTDGKMDKKYSKKVIRSFKKN